MAFLLADRVGETSTTTGTGTLTLLGASPGCETFLIGIGSGNTCYYSIVNPRTSEWEEGVGTVVSGTLERTTVTNSSNADTLVNFKAGTKNVVVSLPAGKLVYKNAAGNVSLPNQTTLSSTDSMLPSSLPSLNLDFVNSGQLDPRITFARNSTAAYYDDKSVAVAEQNLLLQSQTFATTWVTSNTTLGSLITAPDGTTTAYPLTASAINGTLLQTFTATANAYTFSIYIQRVTGTGNIDITVDGTTYATQTTTGTWTRFNIPTTPSAGSKTAGIRLAVSGDVVNIWGAQLEQRSSATAYTPTTTSAITNYIPVLMTAPAGVPRFDCDPITGKSLGLLIEESRTNWVIYSSDFSNAAWLIGTGVNITSNTTIAPDGTLTADKYYLSNGQGGGAGSQLASNTSAGAGAITLSIYVKPAGFTGVYTVQEGSGNGAIFNLATWAPPTSIGNGVGTIIPLPNGWYRLVVTTTSTANAYFYSYISSGTGNGYSGIYVWGAQLEAGSFATSYIPTVASTLTRAADAASMTGTNFSSWWNVSQSTFVVEFDKPNLTNVGTLIGVYGGINLAQMEVTSNAIGSNVLAFFQPSGTLQNAIGSSSLSSNKFAVSFGANLFAPFDGIGTINGASGTFGTGAYFPNPLFNSLYIGLRHHYGDQKLNGHIRKLSYYPRALSSSELQGLTK